MESSIMFRRALSLPILAYDLSRWSRFLLPMVVPGTHRMPVVMGESKDDILQRIPQDFNGLFAFHIDLTDSSRCPDDRAGLIADLLGRGIRTLNGEITNISKRFVQAACRRAGLGTTTADREGDASEILIVKTNRNYGGKPEAKLSSDVRDVLTISAHATYDRPDHGYLVAQRRDVPSGAWDDPTLVVERYIENREQLFYRVYFLCNRFAISEGRERTSIKSIGRSVRHRLLLFSLDEAGIVDAAVPPDLVPAVNAVLRFANVTGMDFGCLDLMRDDTGHFFVVDMNTTASWGNETEFRIIEHLAPRDAA
jgi:hypothetical protein